MRSIVHLSLIERESTSENEEVELISRLCRRDYDIKIKFLRVVSSTE